MQRKREGQRWACYHNPFSPSKHLCKISYNCLLYKIVSMYTKWIRLRQALGVANAPTRSSPTHTPSPTCLCRWPSARARARAAAGHDQGYTSRVAIGVVGQGLLEASRLPKHLSEPPLREPPVPSLPSDPEKSCVAV